MTAGVLPVRPMTVGEILDAATVLLRTRGVVLLTAGALLALLEQAVLFPLRRNADVVDMFFPDEDRLVEFWLLLTVGFALETCCVAVLAGLACAAVPAALFGPAAPARPVPPLRTAATVLIVGLLCGVAGLTAVLGPLAYLLLGLAVPAVVIDRLGPGRALLRSVRLSTRYLMRAGRIRLLGYLSWLLIRLATALAAWAALGLLVSTATATADHLVTALAWLLINAVAYPVLGCLDAVLHIETRMRSEGLDITAQRAAARSASAEVALAVPR